MIGNPISTATYEGGDRKDAPRGGIIVVAFVSTSSPESASEAWRRHQERMQPQPSLNDSALLAVLEGEGDYLLVHDLAPDPRETVREVEESIRTEFGAEGILDLARFERIYAAADARSLSAASKFVFLARADVDPAIDHEHFNHWYDTTHVPDVAGAGLLRAQRFRREGPGDEYLAAYELASPSVLESAELTRVRASMSSHHGSVCFGGRSPNRQGNRSRHDAPGRHPLTHHRRRETHVLATREA